MGITIEELLRDKKEGKFDGRDGIDLILNFFSGDVGDLEKKVFNENEYRRLGWYEQRDFDVINSFYTTYKRALNACGFEFCAKKEYAKKALCENDPLHTDLEKFKKTDIGKQIEEFAKLTHCTANFMPCPSNSGREFNWAKGMSKAFDYLPLYVDLIQNCIDENKDLEYRYFNEIKKVAPGVLRDWQEWLANNVDRYCLDRYYKVRGGKLKGIPLFKKQSLAHPYPVGLKEVNECAVNMIDHIKTRAAKLLR